MYIVYRNPKAISFQQIKANAIELTINIFHLLRMIIIMIIPAHNHSIMYHEVQNNISFAKHHI